MTPRPQPLATVGDASAVSTAEPVTRRRDGALFLRDYGIVAVVVVLFVLLAVSSPVFLTPRNLIAILSTNAALGIVAVGTTLVFIAGGFDFSIGSVYAFTGMVAAQLALGANVIFAFAVAVLCGVIVGVVNGVATTFGRINPFVITLATGIIVGGLATTVGNGALISVPDPSFAVLGRADFYGVPLAVIVWLVFALLLGFVLQRTLIGRWIYAVGGNEEAARFAGIRVKAVRIGCYALAGFGAALSGIIAASHISAGQSNAGGTALAVNAVAAVVIGGTSIRGGEGAIWRTMVGVLLLALITNGFNLLGVNANLQSIFQGGLIVLAVLVDTWLRRRRT